MQNKPRTYHKLGASAAVLPLGRMLQTFAAAVAATPTPAVPSAGCSLAAPTTPGPRILDVLLSVDDAALGPSTRRFRLSVPPNLTSPAVPRPLLLGFHGQAGNGTEFALAHKYEEWAAARGWFMAHPFGIDIQQDPGKDTGWNCGTGGDDSTCLPGTTNNSTHASCARLGKQGRCNWSTCFDDGTFISKLLRSLEASYCLDTSRYGVVGQSNGAMFIHHLITSMPGTFRAAVPCFGTPLLGYLDGAKFELITQAAATRRTAVLSLHGRDDPTIPPGGGRSADGWLYETLNRSTAAWVANHADCDANAPPPAVHTPWDGTTGSRLLCAIACRSNATNRTHVATCMYDAGHGYAQNLTASDDLVWSWFVASFDDMPWPPPATAAAAAVEGPLQWHHESLQRRPAGEPATRPQQHLGGVPVPRPPWPTARFGRRGGALMVEPLRS